MASMVPRQSTATTDDVHMSPYRWFTYKLTQAAMDQRARNQPPPVVEGYDIELVKGRRSQGHLDTSSWVHLMVCVILVLVKMVLVAINASLIAMGTYASDAAVALNATLMAALLISILFNTISFYATWVRSIPLVYLSIITTGFSIALELVLELTLIAVKAASGLGGGGNLEQMFIFMVFIVQMIQILCLVLLVRFLGQLRRSTEEETIVRVSRLAEDPDMRVVVIVDANAPPNPNSGSAPSAPGPGPDSANAPVPSFVVAAAAAAASNGSGSQNSISRVSPLVDAPRSYADGAVATSSVADPATTEGTDASELGGPVQ